MERQRERHIAGDLGEDESEKEDEIEGFWGIWRGVLGTVSVLAVRWVCLVYVSDFGQPTFNVD